MQPARTQYKHRYNRTLADAPAPISRKPPRPLSQILRRARNISDDYNLTEAEADIDAAFHAADGCKVCGLHDLPNPRTGEIEPHTCFSREDVRAKTYNGGGF